ncbi:hypothetical protein [Pseudomonas asiatica]|uniref:hypothetical protein n=1 Tax=Pseudomonas asiatica TaxID=2219225 RepID=UPI0023659E30|nr:hypothetical protein [Pseudomonas asiatica]MDD1982531.1 hypothetical protein [Pseudomonas asiatica]
MNRVIVENNAKLMMEAGIFVKVVSDLFQDNWTAKHGDEPEFLNEYRMSGLMGGLSLVAQELCSRSEMLTEILDKQEEEAQAALARRKGQDNRTQSNVDGKCGTQSPS